jgi:iron complex transport system substrate-binding protein
MTCRPLRRLAAAAAAAAALLAHPPAAADPPRRVVSINLCTDQLAMLLAAPGQLVAVSHLAADPRSSAMAGRAADFPQTRGDAESVFLLRPDLVLAGTFTARATVDLLRRLGIPVVELPPVSRLDAVAGQMLAVGRALGREDEAAAMAQDFEATLAALRADAPRRPATAALYQANGYTAGVGTLADDVLAATGFRNLAAEAGLAGGGILALETLVMAAPDLIVTAGRYPGASRSEEILAHPALLRAAGAAGRHRLSDPDWVCGTPHLLRAVAGMAAARRALGR